MISLSGCLFCFRSAVVVIMQHTTNQPQRVKYSHSVRLPNTIGCIIGYCWEKKKKNIPEQLKTHLPPGPPSASAAALSLWGITTSRSSRHFGSIFPRKGAEGHRHTSRPFWQKMSITKGMMRLLCKVPTMAVTPNASVSTDIALCMLPPAAWQLRPFTFVFFRSLLRRPRARHRLATVPKTGRGRAFWRY